MPAAPRAGKDLGLAHLPGVSQEAWAGVPGSEPTQQVFGATLSSAHPLHRARVFSPPQAGIGSPPRRGLLVTAGQELSRAARSVPAPLPCGDRGDCPSSCQALSSGDSVALNRC